ncbi:MarR family transcriptional regulator [Streptomyces sp. SAJ15]|uniref:MarR family transcriptional regulator n=1 Tax=Streptomyces sp. SAJ15 TaxID=2011095 RepID=UPI001186619F|nr:MarR family transcriptional regulator [Streptomyces sp. SAJ15]TVL91949.1 MarR family transcriptional regulator [Streptomyces sp. SAJ15]
MVIKEYPRERLAAQPIGYWASYAGRVVVGRIRAELAVEGLTQPHWWTLNHVAGAPGSWDRDRLTRRLTPFDDQDTDFDAVFDDLVARGWMTEENGALTLTEAGEAGRLRARERNARAHERMHEGIPTDEYVAALDVLRRVIANLGGESDLP